MHSNNIVGMYSRHSNLNAILDIIFPYQQFVHTTVISIFQLIPTYSVSMSAFVVLQLSLLLATPTLLL